MSNFLNRLRAPNRSGTPGTPGVGEIVFDTSDSKLKQWDGSAWRDMNADKSFPISQVTGLSTALSGKVDTSQLGAANGVATLGSDSKLTTAQLPALGITSVQVVANIAARNALANVQEGDVAVVTDVSRTYIANGGNTATNAGWTELSGPADAVTSVNSQVGAVVLGAADVGAAPATHSHGIGDVVSLQSSLDAKAPLASPTFTGDPKAPTPALNDNDTSIATTAFVQSAISALPASIRRATGTYGDGTATTFTISPGFSGPYVVTVSDAASGEVVFPGMNVGTGAAPTQVVFTHAIAPGANSMRYAIVGG